ncbi:MAG: MlaD family protein [Actinomycetota bacterium]|nr:MlaD family protein [Actinomycetota bacterium]
MWINGITFVAVSGFLIFFGVTRFLIPAQEGTRIVMNAADAAGLQARSDVTIRGVPAGAVTNVRLTENGTADITLVLDPNVFVTAPATAEITRRSPIGDLTVNLIPGDGAPMRSGDVIPAENVVLPPDPERTIQVLSEVLSAVPPEDLQIVIGELALALRTHGDELAALTEAGADLPEEILTVQAQLRSLLTTGPEVLEALAAEADTLADDLVETAVLADILRDRRFDLVELSSNGASFAEVFGDLLAKEKPNLACLVRDFGTINGSIASEENLRNLIQVLELNHFFFEGAANSVQPSTDGHRWFRVHLLPPSSEGRPNTPPRARPDVFGSDACHNRYGTGVGPGNQAGDPYIAPGSELHRGR